MFWGVQTSHKNRLRLVCTPQISNDVVDPTRAPCDCHAPLVSPILHVVDFHRRGDRVFLVGHRHQGSMSIGRLSPGLRCGMLHNKTYVDDHSVTSARLQNGNLLGSMTRGGWEMMEGRGMPQNERMRIGRETAPAREPVRKILRRIVKNRSYHHTAPLCMS